jgi:hypothetical protein
MGIKEEEIRPKKIFNEYLRLAKKDATDFFSNVSRDKINCPSCGSLGKMWISKHGFNYDKCPKCFTIYVNPRPCVEAFNSYYEDAPSTKYWATTFYKVTENARREKLWRPKAQMISNQIDTYGKEIQYIIDIGGGYGVFCEEFKKIKNINSLIIEPSVHLAEVCRKKGFDVIEKFLEDIKKKDLPKTPKCFVSFELFEHLHDPTIFLKNLYNIMDYGDMFIFTTLSGMGIDIKLLKENSKSISPPHHLNFFNPKSVCFLLEKLGFKIHESSTPGKLDMDILIKDKSKLNDEFWTELLEYVDDQEIEKIQKNIADLGLSSHMMITCQK